VHIVSSAKVWNAVGKNVQRAFGLKDTGAVHLMNDAEAAKNLRTVELLTSELVRGGADRKSLVIAVGGGVVGDVAGFVAATYLRGVRSLTCLQQLWRRWIVRLGAKPE